MSGLLVVMIALVTGPGMSPAATGKVASSSAAAGAGVAVRVLWRATEYKVSEGASWAKADAEELLKPLDIGKDYITFGGQTCRGVVFDQARVPAEEYLRQTYRTSPRALGIGEESLNVVKTNCALPGFAEYMRLKDRRLLIHIKGLFVFFEPAVEY